MSDPAFIPSKSFHDAANYVSTDPKLKSVSNDIKLELYALYKMVTVSRTPNTSCPSIFDMTGRAKWQAWDKQSKALSKLSLDDIQSKYLERCTSLGWVPSAESTSNNNESNVAPNKGAVEEEDVHDIDWDAPYDPTKDGHGSRAMGNKVSVLEQAEDDEADQTTLHGLAELGDAGRLRTLLELDRSLKIDEKNENGYTPLHLAADRGNTEVVELLLKHGADRSVQDADGFSAIELAEASGKEEVVELLKTAS